MVAWALQWCVSSNIINASSVSYKKSINQIVFNSSHINSFRRAWLKRAVFVHVTLHLPHKDAILWCLVTLGVELRACFFFPLQFGAISSWHYNVDEWPWPGRLCSITANGREKSYFTACATLLANQSELQGHAPRQALFFFYWSVVMQCSYDTDGYNVPYVLVGWWLLSVSLDPIVPVALISLRISLDPYLTWKPQYNKLFWTGSSLVQLRIR